MEHEQGPQNKGINPDARAAAEAAAHAAGLSVDEWISRTILNAVSANAPPTPKKATAAAEPPAEHPREKHIRAAAEEAGQAMEEWLSRAVLQSLAEGARAKVAEYAKSEGNGAPRHKEARAPEPLRGEAGPAGERTILPNRPTAREPARAADADKSAEAAAPNRPPLPEESPAPRHMPSSEDLRGAETTMTRAPKPDIALAVDAAEIAEDDEWLGAAPTVHGEAEPVAAPEWAFAEDDQAAEDPDAEFAIVDEKEEPEDAAKDGEGSEVKERPLFEGVDHGAERLAEIINRTRRAQHDVARGEPGKALVPTAGRGGLPATITQPPASPAKKISTGLVLAVLAVIAVGIWAMPSLPWLRDPPPAEPDFVAGLPGGEAKSAEPAKTRDSETAKPPQEAKTPEAPKTPEEAKTPEGKPASPSEGGGVKEPKVERLPLPGEAKPPVTAETPKTTKPGEPKAAAVDPSLPAPSRTETNLPVPPAKHIEWYKLAAERGNTKAQVVLAGLYLLGEAVPKDAAKAAELYRHAAAEGNDPDAQYTLGYMLERGEGVKKDEIEALLWYKRAALAGQRLAMYRAGLAYADGRAVPKSYARAREYFEDAAKRGLPDAAYRLGLIYEQGLGTAADKETAHKYFTQAAAGGHALAAKALERLAAVKPEKTEPPKAAQKVPEKAPEKAPQQAALPKAASPSAIIPDNLQGQAAIYARAAKLGNTKAQMELARLYLQGEGGVSKDYGKAAALFRIAATEGKAAEAQYALAVMLDRGLGVRRDPDEAIRWYNAAANAGHPRAMLNIGYAYAKGEGLRQDYGQARLYFERAAAKNLAEAQYNLGLIYENGLGVKRDLAVAFKWFSLAVANRNEEAGKALDRLIPQMSDAEIARAKDLLSKLD